VLHVLMGGREARSAAAGQQGTDWHKSKGLAIEAQHRGDVARGSCRPWVRGGTEYTCAGT
jgi:hypothetical protein